MKVRTGFVSNSSSASFTIQTTMTEDSFFEFLQESLGWSHFYKDTFERRLKHRVKTLNENIAEEKQNLIDDKENELESSLHELWKGQSEDSLKEVESILKRLPDMKEHDVIKTILTYNGITISESLVKHIEVSAFTFMYNDMGDMGPMMIAILAALGMSFGGNGFRCVVDDN